MAVLKMHSSAIVPCKFTVIYLLFLFIASANCQRRRRQFDPAPEIPSHLPAPPKASAPAPPPSNAGGGGAGGQIGGALEGQPPVPPPQNTPFGPLGPGQLVPFGLNHIILIIVPTFKMKFRKNQDWFTSKVKVSMPITVFFDQLKVPPELLAKGIAGFPLPPLGIPPPVPPPGGLGPIPPPAHPNLVPPSAGGAPVANAQTNAGYGYYYPRKPYIYGGGHDADADESNDGVYENEIYSDYTEDDRKKRRKRDLFTNRLFDMESAYNPHFYNHSKFRPKRAASFNSTLHLTDRASLFPRLENILASTDFGGKPCLLRAVCEVHEGPLNHYGLLGELITMIFSVSKSMFAESHLPDYLRAEALGRSGDCTEFFKDCETTYFSWEEKIMHSNDI